MLYHQVLLMLVLKKTELELHLDFRGARIEGDELFFPIHRTIVMIGSEQDSATQHCHALPQC